MLDLDGEDMEEKTLVQIRGQNGLYPDAAPIVSRARAFRSEPILDGVVVSFTPNGQLRGYST